MATAAERSLPASSPQTERTADSARLQDSEITGKGRVLIADDEPALLRGLQRLLQGNGYQVVAARDGAEAELLFRSEQFDVVLTDIAMPGLSGIELLMSVRAKDPDIPVVLITGEPAVSTAVKALEYGAFHYLTKPVDLPTLNEVVDKASRLRRMAQMKRRAAELLGSSSSSGLESLQRSFDSVLDTLWLGFQPIVEAGTGRVYGYEALLRSEEAALPHPGAVLDAAEKLQRTDELSRVIRGRCAQVMNNGADDVVLFVNLQTTDLLDPELTSPSAPLSQIADRVILEITERSSIEKIADVRQRIADLRQLGYRIAVDDLGAGYAGLTSFALLEPEIVKLDMTLVRNVHQSPTRQKLIRSMTSLCKDMGMLVVGEGVETIEERRTLIDLGCDLLQGYLLARPGRPFPQVSW